MVRKRIAAEFLGGDCKPIRIVSGGIWTAEKDSEMAETNAGDDPSVVRVQSHSTVFMGGNSLLIRMKRA
jgi:hypothetical protein